MISLRHSIRLPTSEMPPSLGYRPTEAAFEEVFGIRDDGTFSPFCDARDATCDSVRDMGFWSDGVRVTRIENAADRGL